MTPDPTSKPAEGPYVFISYSRENADVARDIADRLVRARIGVWIDERNLRAGDRFEPAIEAAVGCASCVLVLCSPSALRSEWVTRESALALERGTPTMPILLEGTAETSVAKNLQSLQYVDLRKPSSFEGCLSRLIAAIYNHIDPTYLDAAEIDDDLRVPDMLLEHHFLRQRALRPDELRGSLSSDDTPLPGWLQGVREQHVARVLDEAKRRGQTVDNNLS